MKATFTIIKFAAMITAGSMSVHAVKGDKTPLINTSNLTQQVGQMAASAGESLSPKHYAAMVGNELHNMVHSHQNN